MTVIRINGSSTGNQPQGSDVQSDVSLALGELNNVDATTNLANNSIIKYNSTASQWQIGSDTDTGIAAVVDDTTPELGGDLDVLTRSIVSSSARDITLAPDGAGLTNIKNAKLTSNLDVNQQFITNSGANAVRFSDPIEISGTAGGISVTKSDDSANAGPILQINRTSASPDTDDLLGQIKFMGNNDADQTVDYGSITGRIGRKNDGSERGLINFNAIDNGSDQLIMSMSRKGLFMGAGHVVALGGDSANFFTSLYATDPTANRTITFPDATGTAVLTDTTDTLTNKTLTNPVISQVVSVSDGNIELDPNGTGKVVLDAITNINGNRTNASLFIDTDMSSDLTDDLANAIECQLDYTGATIGSNTRQQSIVFKFKDDAIDLQAGRFTSEFTSADTKSNKMKLIAIDNSASGAVNGQIHISPKQGSVNVPWELPTYAVGSLPTAGIGAGAIAYATGLNSSDVSTGKAMVFNDGSNWKYMHIPQTTARS